MVKTKFVLHVWRVGLHREYVYSVAVYQSKCCQHCNRSTLINYYGLKSQIKWQLSELCMVEILYLVKELRKEPFFQSFPNDKF